MTNWHNQTTDEALAALHSHSGGLSAAEAAQRLAAHGPNELVERGGRSPWRIVWEQLTSTMVLILIAATVVSALLGDEKDAVAIGAIVVLFALMGFIQEYRAERAIAALKRLAVPAVRVMRAGELRELPARELAPGDIVALEAGNFVPADGRILDGVNLRIQESALTGESEPVEKSSAPLPGERPLADRLNMAYRGTTVTYGRGKLLVTATGMQTELGRIAALLQTVDAGATPLQRKLDELGKRLALVGVLVAGAVFALGLWRGDEPRHMLLVAVSIAVAIVPEGLPAVITITLALGAQRMLQRNALIRKLPAVETLGSVTVICSDKTGTLTENRMTVVVMDVAGRRVDVAEELSGEHPVLALAEREPDRLAQSPEAIRLLLTGGALCNDATLSRDPQDGRFRALGDPTEGALLIAAMKLGIARADLERDQPRVAELPFDSDRKRMTTIHRLRMPAADGALAGRAYVAYTKGAVDGLLDISASVWDDGRAVPIDDAWRARIHETNAGLAQNGMRVLGVAFKPLDAAPAAADMAQTEAGLTFVGVFGLIDPPRAEVKAAVQTCRAAGIRPVMITGDHPLTAATIARELGIATDARALTGAQLSAMSADELAEAVARVSVFARVSPEHKLRIVEALQKQGQIVAMTGDGVNDAPALRKADIGVAMGLAGTDVAKEAADMVLRDDNFATIVSAVEEGRTIYDNLRKFLRFSIAGNIGKVAVMLLAPFLGKPLPLAPLQLLWLNLLTDGLLGLGLGVEPTERGAMQRPPHTPGEGLFDRAAWWQIARTGALIGAVALAVGYGYWIAGRENWQTMVFTTLAFTQIAQAQAARALTEAWRPRRAAANRPLAALSVLVFGLQLAAVYVPFLAAFFDTRPLTTPDLALCLALAAAVFLAMEAEKWRMRMGGTASRGRAKS